MADEPREEPDPLPVIRARMAFLEDELRKCRDMEKIALRPRRTDPPKKRLRKTMDVIRHVVPPTGMPIEELRQIIRDTDYEEKPGKLGSIDLAIRKNGEVGNIVIRDYTVYLPEHDPKPGEPSQKLPPEWYSALEPKI